MGKGWIEWSWDPPTVTDPCQLRMSCEWKMFCAPEMIGNVSWALVSCKILSMFHSGGVLLWGLCQYHYFRTPTRKKLFQLNSTNMNVFADVLSLPIWLVTLIDNRHHYHIVMPMANAQRRTLAPQREEKQAAANSRPTIQLNSSPKSIQSPSLVGCWAIQIQCLQRWGPSSHTTPGETNLRHDSKTWNKNITHQNHIQGIQGLANVV